MEAVAELILEGGDARRDGGLCCVQLVSGGLEGTQPRYPDKSFQEAKIHRFPIRAG
jgi:hypothetical protein